MCEPCKKTIISLTVSLPFHIPRNSRSHFKALKVITVAYEMNLINKHGIKLFEIIFEYYWFEFWGKILNATELNQSSFNVQFKLKLVLKRLLLW